MTRSSAERSRFTADFSRQSGREQDHVSEDGRLVDAAARPRRAAVDLCPAPKLAPDDREFSESNGVPVTNERIRQRREDSLGLAAMFVDVDAAEVGSDLLNEPEISGEHYRSCPGRLMVRAVAIPSSRGMLKRG